MSYSHTLTKYHVSSEGKKVILAHSAQIFLPFFHTLCVQDVNLLFRFGPVSALGHSWFLIGVNFEGWFKWFPAPLTTCTAFTAGHHPILCSDSVVELWPFDLKKSLRETVALKTVVDTSFTGNTIYSLYTFSYLFFCFIILNSNEKMFLERF